MVRPLPLSKTRGAQKIKHVLQADTEAPTFVLHMNRKVSLHPADVRYLENSIRAQWPFTATPLRLVFEACDAAHASPALLAQCALEYLQHRSIFDDLWI